MAHLVFNYNKQNNDNSDKCERCRLNHDCELMDEYRLFLKNNPPKIMPAPVLLTNKTVDTNSTLSESGNKIRVTAYHKTSRPKTESPEYRRIDRESCKLNFGIPCGSKTIKDGIGDFYKINTSNFDHKIAAGTANRWETYQPVFISAQTGKGKNYFIENTLIPYIRQLNYEKKTDYKILHICNRKALASQIINRIKDGVCSENYKQDEKYSYSDIVDVMSYQSLLNRIDLVKTQQKNKIGRYIFVICDEAHFFTSDAMFNPDTEKILSAIPAIFNDAIRIYMTATPYECYREICKYERSPSVVYHFIRDYSYLDIKYYRHYSDLKDLIMNKEKWLIFIDDKDECKKFKSELDFADDESADEDKGFDEKDRNDIIKTKGDKSEKSKIYTVCADSKYERRYQNMVLNEKFGNNTRVLIATSVIDNGVNFTDVKNVVISDVSKVKCLQMLGRARINKEERITVYIKRFDEKYIKKRISDLKKQQDAYHDYDIAYERAVDYSDDTRRKFNYKHEFRNKYYNSKVEDWENAKYWFGVDKDDANKIYLNGIARSQVNALVPIYESILSDMHSDDINALPGQKYLEYQLSWFGHKYNKENDLSLKAIDDNLKILIDFLESCADKELYGSDQNEFSKKFTELHDQLFPRRDRNKERIYGVNQINKSLEEHNMKYIIEHTQTSKDNKTYWKVIRSNSKDSEKHDGTTYINN